MVYNKRAMYVKHVVQRKSNGRASNDYDRSPSGAVQGFDRQPQQDGKLYRTHPKGQLCKV